MPRKKKIPNKLISKYNKTDYEYEQNEINENTSLQDNNSKNKVNNIKNLNNNKALDQFIDI